MSLTDTWGAVLLAPDRTRFRLWAPDCGEVGLEIEGQAPQPELIPPAGPIEEEVGVMKGVCMDVHVCVPM